jgi:glyoxylase-like metal-dependent hydrolase (beta-lactamase superfamily II)
VFSHHHVDHIFGVAPFEDEASERKWARPLVYGHAGLRPNFDRYKKTRGWNAAINVRQFAIPLEVFTWPGEYRYADVEYHDGLTMRVGGLTFELHHGRGETDDATWTWIPERKILAPGDLFIWASPNAGNPQKTQRYCGEWAAALPAPDGRARRGDDDPRSRHADLRRRSRPPGAHRHRRAA